MKTVKHGTTVLTVIIFFLLVSCDNFIHELIPPNDNLITSFTLDRQSGKTAIGENTITISWYGGMELDRPVNYHVSVSPKASLLPVTTEYIQAAFPWANPSEVINRINEAPTDMDLTALLEELVRQTPNFRMPSLDKPIDFSRPVTFLVISGRDGTIRPYTTNVTVNVRFESNGGSEVDPVIVNYGETVPKPNPNPTKTDHGFGGWYTDDTAFYNVWDFGNETVTGDLILYARWTPGEYTVSFESNGGSDIPDQPVKHGFKATRPDDDPSRIGYTFDNWYGDEWFIGEMYDFDAPIFGDTTLYAKWNPITYIVRYNKNANDATRDMIDSYHIYDKEEYLNPNLFKHEGYDFAGWAMEEDGKVIFDDGELVSKLTDTAGETVTLFAQWSCTVMFNKNSIDAGSTEADPLTKKVTTPDKYIDVLPAEPTRRGWTFAGWNTEANGSGTPFIATDTVNGNTTVYAQWYCFVSFDGNGATGGTGPGPIRAYAGSTIEHLPDEGSLTRTGYTFAGWNKNPNGKEDNFISGASFSPNGNTTLYAKWIPITYIVRYNKNADDATGETDDSNHTYDEEQPLSPNQFTRTEYNVAGWATEPGGDLVYRREALVKNLTDKAGDIVPLYAVWGGLPYYIEYHANGGLGNMEPDTFYLHVEDRLSLNTFNRTGYDFVGWAWTPEEYPSFYNEEFVRDLAPAGETVDLYAQWKPIVYTITYKDVGDKPFSGTHGLDPPNTHTYDKETTLVDPTKTPGYTFGGWFDNIAGTGNPLTSLAATGYKEDITLYAKWNPIVYTITYMDVGNVPFSGTHGLNPPNTHTYDEKTTLVDPTKTPGYTFGGWFDDIDGSGNSLTFLAAMGYERDITLYAKWTLNQYIVTFNTNGGSYEPSRTILHGDSVSPPVVNNPTKTDSIFAGWYSDSALTISYDFSDPVLSDIIVYAKWIPNVYTITYRDIGNVPFSGVHGSNPPTTHTYGIETRLVDPSRAGYTFEGWFDNIACTGNRLTLLAATGYKENIILYAKWTLIYYIVTFNKNNTDTGSTDATPPTIPVAPGGNNVENLPTQPTRPRWEFDGWNTERNGNGTVFDEEYKVNSNITVYAQWKCIVTFDKNNSDAGSTEAIFQEKLVKSSSPRVGELPTTEPTRPNWIFNGWNTKADGSGTPFTATTTVTGNTIVYAKWIGIGGGSPWFIVFRVDDAAPLLKPIIISRTGTSISNPPRTVTITVDDSQYTSVTWYIHSTNISVTGKSITLDAANSYYNNIGEHSLTVVAVKNGISYSRTITFEVVR